MPPFPKPGGSEGWPRRAAWAVVLCALFLLPAGRPSLHGQPTSPPVQDPLMNLMLAQPKIDIDSPVNATAAFDPPVIRPDELTTYRVAFNALEESIEWPKTLPGPAQLEFRPGGHGQIFQLGGLAMVPRTSYNYHARPTAPGEFVLPSFVVNVYGKPVTVPAARLVVSASAPAQPASASRLILEAPVTNLFVGQAARVQVFSPGSVSGVVQGLSQVQFPGQGFIVDQTGARQRIERMTLPDVGTNVVVFVYETTLTPITAGKLSVFAQGYSAGNRFSGTIIITGPATIPGGPPLFTLLDSDPVELVVQPLPRAGELPGFSGAVGTFVLDPTNPPSLATNVLCVGDPVKLTVRVRGDGNLARLIPPPLPRVPDWQLFAGPADTLPPQVIQAQGFTTLSFTLIPLSATANATPAIPFSYFDPARGKFTDLSIPPLPVTVKAGPVAADLLALRDTNAAAEVSEKEPVLSELAPARGLTATSLVPLQLRAWFPFMQLAPGAVFLGLWGWVRRRRYLEQHPDVVLRQRARRALRRDWRVLRKAARAGDAARFAAAAVSALRAACAPHYPAEPRALVGADVLRLLGDEPAPGRPAEVVRRFFAVTDASRFADNSPDTAELLPLQPELEHVLERLEARL